MSNPVKFSFSEFFTEGQYITQEETLAVERKASKLLIGVPKEESSVENRVALVPHSVRTIMGYGHNIKVESEAGNKSNYSDNDFSEAGAEICFSKKEIFNCDIVIKIAPPTLDEIDLLKDGGVLISPIQLPLMSEEYIKKLQRKRITALAMEYLQSDDGSFPIVRIMSEIAGMSAVSLASEYLNINKGGRGILFGGVSGVPPAKVVVLGAGVVGEFVVKAALGLGASIRIFDNDITKLMRIQTIVGRQLHTSSLNPVYLAYQLTSADVVIGAMHSKHGRTPVIVTEEMVSKMKDGSVIIDISIDQGGCIETSKMTTLDKPTFVKHGVIHYCVPNIASNVSRTASAAVSNILTPLLIKIGSDLAFENILYSSPGIRNGCYTYKGCLTNEYLGNRFGLKYSNLNLLLASKI
jgi:alanine dehydrogenase